MGFNIKPKPEPLRRDVIKACLVICVLITFCFSVFSFAKRDFAGGILNSISALGFMIGIIALHLNKWNSITSFVSVFLSAPLFLFDVAYGSPVRYDLLWSLTIPVFTLPLLGRKAGVVLAVAYWFATAIILLGFETELSGSFIRIFLLIYAFITLAFWLYETFRIQALERQAEGEKAFREFVDNLPQIIFEFDERGRFTYVNAPALDAFGYSKEDLDSGVYTHQLFPPNERDRAMSSIDNRIRKNSNDSHEYIAMRKDGSTFPVLIHSNPIIKNGKGRGLRGIVVDITELKNAQAEKEELSSQLHQVEKMDAVGKLAGGIAHDFNNQLAGIIGYADLISVVAKEENSDIVEYSKRIKRIGTRASELISQLLAFARKGKYLSVQVDIKKMVMDTVYILERSINKNIVINEYLSSGNLLVKGDPSQLQSMLLNLSINARDAMPDGGKLIIKAEEKLLDANDHIIVKNSAAAGGYVVLTVSDNGIGMSEEVQRRMFEPFFTTKEQGKGTGIGLAAVYGTVVNHKGFIDVKSEVGTGTVFTVYLPLAVFEGDVAGQVENEHKSGVVNSDSPRYHILVVDDEESVRTMISELLKAMGHTVHVEAEGSAAIAWYGNNWKRIDLVLLDMIMPGMDGRAVWNNLRQINANVKVLLISGFSMQGDAQIMLSNGAVGFLQKPFDSNSLKASITKAFADQHSR